MRTCHLFVGILVVVVAACDPAPHNDGSSTDDDASGGSDDTVSSGGLQSNPSEQSSDGVGDESGATATPGGGDPCAELPEDMVCVPPTSFQMGCREDPSDDDKNCRRSEVPVHEVQLSGFFIDRHEVTVGRYRACVEAGACLAVRPGESCDYHLEGREEHPVSCVDYSRAVSYCEWLGRRLPTEAEWELAAGGEDSLLYPWGNEWAGCDKAIMFTLDHGEGCGRDSSWPVGSRPEGASPYGALDMRGNIAELVADIYDAEYYANSPRMDPKGPVSGNLHVVRGGSWEGTLNAMGVQDRWSMISGDSVHQVGFRCAMSAEGKNHR